MNKLLWTKPEAINSIAIVMAFTFVLKSTLVLLVYMFLGYSLVKMKVGVSSHAKTLSSFLVYFGTPSMIIASFQGMTYTPQNGLEILKFFITCMLTQFVFYLILKLIFNSKMSDKRYRILTLGGFLGNVGFIGIPIATSIYPDLPIVPCYCVVYAAAMNIMNFTIGEYLITGDRKHISIKKALLNPATYGLFIAIPLYILDIKLPTEIGGIFTMIKNMTAPICMIILGLRLASMNFKEIFANPFTYAVSGLKLLAYPLFAYVIVLFLPWFDTTFKTTLLLTSGCPVAAVTLSLCEIHECAQKEAANAVLMTSILCVITLPLLVMIAG